MYKKLCMQFYELSKPAAPEDAYAFYRKYASEARGTILEPMCGTGHFLLPLAKEGFKIEGSDASIHMLDALKEKAQKLGVVPNVWQSVAGDIPNNKTYSLIFIPRGSFGLISDQLDIVDTLRSFYEHLEDNGKLVFEAETLHALPELNVRREKQVRRTDGKTIRLSSFAKLENDICVSHNLYELLGEDKIEEQDVEEYRIKIYTPKELIDCLQKLGFTRVRAVKAFDQSKEPGESDPAFVYECTK